MKLGATTTSERGKAITKTGNNFLNINLTDDRGVSYCELLIEQEEGFFYPTVKVDSLGKVEELKTSGNLKHGKEYQRATDGEWDEHN